MTERIFGYTGEGFMAREAGETDAQFAERKQRMQQLQRDKEKTSSTAASAIIFINRLTDESEVIQPPGQNNYAKN